MPMYQAIGDNSNKYPVIFNLYPQTYFCITIDNKIRLTPKDSVLLHKGYDYKDLADVIAKTLHQTYDHVLNIDELIEAKYKD